MPSLANPVVNSLVEEFTKTVEELVRAFGVISAENRVAVVRELCQLSRDTRLDMGPVDEPQACDVATCFRNAANRIQNLWSEHELPTDVKRYCANIVRRADRLVEGASHHS